MQCMVDKLHRDLNSRFVEPVHWPQMKHKNTVVIDVNSTQVTECKQSVSYFETDYIQHVEQQYRERASSITVDFFEIVRPHWEKDRTGENAFPKHSDLSL